MIEILLVSPYHGGSHRDWAEGYQRHSRHQIHLLTLPDRFWKWRMHGGAVTLARAYNEANHSPDLIVATDMLDLTTFLALTQARCPTILYMHENQLTYPLPKETATGPMRRQRGERDLHYAFINYASMLAATRVAFNSRFHHDSFFDALPRFLKHFPEHNEMATIDELQAKSGVLPVGIDFDRLAPPSKVEEESDTPPLILWNQRWEYDKNPAAFFRAIIALHEGALPFRLALCGQNFRQRPAEFHEAIEKLGAKIAHVGFAEPDVYRRLLWSAEITISTALHEFFGISILEAIYCRTFPILPRRLSYPELIPDDYHQTCLYEKDEGLVERLHWAIYHRTEARRVASALSESVAKYAWPLMAPIYDAAFESLTL